MLFKGRNVVPHSYSRFGYTRNGGAKWHGGIDVQGIDDATILMPAYNGKSISGTVVTSRIVTDKNNLTWQWGYYVCIKLNDNQTSDGINYLYFCHNEKNLVQVGQSVKTGDEIAIMGVSGNAKDAVPPTPHVHFEVRQTSSGTGKDPTAYAGVPNEQGTFGEGQTSAGDEETEKSYKATVLVNGLRLRTLPNTDDTTVVITMLEKDKQYDLLQTKDGWAFVKADEICGGWACIELEGEDYIKIEEK